MARAPVPGRPRRRGRRGPGRRGAARTGGDPKLPAAAGGDATTCGARCGATRSTSCATATAATCSDGARELVPIAEAAGGDRPEALTPERELEAAQAQAQQRAAVERTLARLRLDDAEVLRLKYLEERAPDEIAAELGITRTQYERRLAAGQRARPRRVDERGVRTHRAVPCGSCCAAGTRFTRHDAARIDVHLLDCLHCRAFALRARGLLEVIGVSVIGAWERLAARLGARDRPRRRSGRTRRAGRGAGQRHRRRRRHRAHRRARHQGRRRLRRRDPRGRVRRPARARVRAQTDRLINAAQRPAHALRRAERRRAPAAATPPATRTAVAAAYTATPTPTATPTATAKPKRQSTRREVSASERRRRQRAATAREFGPEATTPQVNTHRQRRGRHGGRGSVNRQRATAAAAEAAHRERRLAQLVLQRGVPAMTATTRRIAILGVAAVLALAATAPHAVAGTATVYQCTGPGGQAVSTDMLTPSSAWAMTLTNCGSPYWPWGLMLTTSGLTGSSWLANQYGEARVSAPPGTLITGGTLVRQMLDYHFEGGKVGSSYGFGYWLRTADGQTIELCGGTGSPPPDGCLPQPDGLARFPNPVRVLTATKGPPPGPLVTPALRIALGCFLGRSAEGGGGLCYIYSGRESARDLADGAARERERGAERALGRGLAALRRARARARYRHQRLRRRARAVPPAGLHRRHAHRGATVRRLATRLRRPQPRQRRSLRAARRLRLPHRLDLAQLLARRPARRRPARRARRPSRTPPATPPSRCNAPSTFALPVDGLRCPADGCVVAPPRAQRAQRHARRAPEGHARWAAPAAASTRAGARRSRARSPTPPAHRSATPPST